MPIVVIGAGTVYTVRAATPDPPVAPQTYTVPGGATSVSTAAALKTALAANAPNIVLQDGTYDDTANFSSFDSNLYAANLGGAILTAGLGVNPTGSGSGPTVQGLKLNCSTKAKASSGLAALEVWDPYLASPGVKIKDCQFDGGSGSVCYGIRGSAMPNGVIQRCVVKNYRDNIGAGGFDYPVGVRLEDVGSGIGSYALASVTDLDISNISATTPGSSGGTAEVGLWIGHEVTGGVYRIKCRTVSLASIETVYESRNTLFSDLDIDMSGANNPTPTWTVGVYQEHYTVNNVFQKFAIKACHTGFNSEWNDGSDPSSPDTTTTAGFTQPALNGTVNVTVGSTASVGTPGNVTQFTGVWINGAGFYAVDSITSSTVFVLRNLGFPGSSTPGATITSGKSVSNGIAAGHQNTYQLGSIDATGANGTGWCGIYGDQGTESMTVFAVKFTGQTFAAIAAYKNIGSLTQSGNDFSALGIGGAQTSTAHI